MDKKNVDVVIATPGHGMHSEYVLSLTNTIHELTKNKISWRWVYGYSAQVHRARELALSQANFYNYKKIFWIDSDISWNIESFNKLLSSNKEIISGAYLMANGTTCAVNASEKFLTKEEVLMMKDKVKISDCGFGFICVTKDAMNTLKNPFNSVELLSSEGVVWAGEDVSWCLRMSSLGYDIWFDPDVLVNHHKNITISW